MFPKNAAESFRVFFAPHRPQSHWSVEEWMETQKFLLRRAAGSGGPDTKESIIGKYIRNFILALRPCPTITHANPCHTQPTKCAMQRMDRFP
jgi:hypothetical protein